MSRKLKVLDLFSGIGGFSLGLERTGGFETVAFCEIDPFCQKVLNKHWPDVPIYEDVRTLDYDGEIDIITGGFPCQPFSTASRGRITAEDMWPEFERITGEVKPKFAIAENVSKEPIDRAAEHFRNLGMQCIVVRISGDDIGADHTRNRWWAIAHPYKSSKLQSAIHAETSVMRSLSNHIWGPEAYKASVCLSDGFPSGLAGNRTFGNAVMPQIPELLGRSILQNGEIL